MEDTSGVLAMLGADGFRVRVHVRPAGRRSLLAEMAMKSLMDSRGISGEMSGSGSGYGHVRGGAQSVFLAEICPSGIRGPPSMERGWDNNRGASMAQIRVTKEWPERDEREICPVRDTDCGSSARKPVTSISNHALNYARSSPIGRRMRSAPSPYVSNYQRDHCQLRPMSSALSAAEFPRQLSRPDLMTGNFAIGESPTEPVHGSERGHRRSHYVRTSEDYGWFYNRSRSISPDRCSDEAAFVASLRKYPSAPESTKSDLLQAVACLQQNVNNKNLQVKTLRYLREKAREVESELQRLQDKLSKKQINEEPTRETAGPSRENTPKYRDTKSSFLREHTAVFKHKNRLTMKRSLSYENYNYLKTLRQDCAKTMALKRTDVRYLTDITSGLRKFINGTDESMQSTICSKLSKRYMDHCRLHHKKSADQGTLYDETDHGGADDYNSGASRSPRSCRPPKICCHCRKPVPCGCKKKRMTREEFIVQKINEWLEAIPIYPNETFLEKALRDDLIKKLKSSLVRLPAGKDFLDAAGKYIEQCMEKLPMWRPESKGEQDLLQKQVANNLLQKLEGVTAFAIDKEIIDAFDNVKFKLKDSNSMLVSRYDLMKDVTDQLRDLIQKRPSDEKVYRERLRSKIADILAELPIETRPGKKRETLEKLADEITDKLMKIQTKPGGGRSSLSVRDDGTKPKQFFDQRAENILKSIPGIEDMSKNERNIIQQEISKKIQDVRRLSNEAEVKDVMVDIIADVVKRTGVTIGEQKQKKLAERLTGQVTTSSNTGTEEKLLWSIVGKMPELESVSKPEMNKAINQFALTIRQIKRSGDTNFESNVQEETAKLMNALAKSSSKRIKPEAISKMKDKISKDVIQYLQKFLDSPRGSVDSGKVKMISKWLEEIEHFLLVKKSIRDKMATELARKLNAMQKQSQEVHEMMPEEILKALKDVTKESGVEFHPVQEEEISDKLLEKITKVMVDTADQENAIWETIDAMPTLQDIDQSVHYKAVKDLAMKLQDIKVSGGMETDIQNTIKTFTDDLSQKTGVKPEVPALAEKLTKKLEIRLEQKTKDNMTLLSERGTKDNTKKIIKDEVTDILNETSVPLGNDTQKELESLIADQVMRGKAGEQARTEISRFLNSTGLPMDEAESIARTLTRNIDKKLDVSFEESFREEAVDEILDFIYQFSKSTDGSDAATSRSKNKKLAEELAKTIQNIKADPTLSTREKETKIRDETAKVLQKVDLKSDVSVKQLASKLAKKLDTATARSSTPIPGTKKLNASVSSSDIALSPITSDTLFIPKRGKAPKPAKKSTDHLDQAIRDWCAQKRVNISEDKVKKLASEFVEWSRHFDESAEYDTLDEEGSLKIHLRQWLEVNTDLSERDDFPSLVDSLIERLRSIPLPSTSSATARMKRGDIPAGPENAAELSDWIARWCDKLPVVASTSPQDQAKLKSLKQNLISKLMLKIGALNMNPETLNDDFLYENMLSDEIDQLLEEFPQSRELANSKAELKKELLNLVIMAKQNIKEELAGNSYKQQIKDAIKMWLPCVCKSADIQVKFEGLRSNIADAFISLKTAIDDQKSDEATDKYNEEVNTYISAYTKDTGGRPNVTELKRKLLKELRNIQEPSSAALKSQLEEISVRDTVKAWIRQLSLRSNLTAQQEVQMHKIISVLGLRLRELEKQNQSKPDVNYDKKLQSEIAKWLSKLPLQENVSIQTLSPRFAESFKNRVRPDVKSIPSTTLSAADRAHMDRIRNRSGDDWLSERLCPSASGRPCMATITEGSCQTLTSYQRPCRSFSRVVAVTSLKCCQNSTQTISCKASQTCVTPQQCLSRASTNLQTPFHCQGMQDQSQCVRSSGYYQPCRAPRRYNVNTPCSSTAYPSNPCNATYDTTCSRYPSCASHGPPCLQALSPQMKPPSCLMKRTFRERPRTSVQIEEPTDYGCRDYRASETRYYKESATNAEVSPRQNYVQRAGRQQGNSSQGQGCQRPPELSQNTCADQRGPIKCKKRRDWRRRSILSSKGPCKSCAEPAIKCNRLCTRNCPHPSFLYFRH